MTTVVVPLSAFLRFISVSRFRALRASRSAGGRLFFGFVISISARSLRCIGGSHADLTW